MRRWHWVLWVLPFVLLGAALTTTWLIRAADPLPAIKARMMVAAYANLRTDYFVQNGVLLHWISQAATVERAADRLPDWAGTRDRCYRWEADFQVRNRTTQDAVAQGRYVGWIAIAPDKTTWILEMRRTDDLSGEDVLVIDAWDPPGSSSPRG